MEGRRRGESSASILTLYHRRVPGDVTSRANSRGSYGNGAANTKPKSIRCTLSPAYCTRRPWGFVALEVGDGRERERGREGDRFGRRKMHRHEGRKTEYVDLVMGQCASVTTRYCVSRSLFMPVLPPRLTRSTRWHPWVLALPTCCLLTVDRIEKKKSCPPNPFEIFEFTYRVERKREEFRGESSSSLVKKA